MAGYEAKPPRASRAREAAPRYGQSPAAGGGEPRQAPAVYHVTIDERGRVMLPADVREALKIRNGDRIALIFEADGTMSLKTQEVAISHLRGMFKHLSPKGHYASDELIAERRREARMEDRKFREWSKRLRRAGKTR